MRVGMNCDLSNLKVGDEVILSAGGGWERRWERRKVDKVTKLHIIIGNQKYRFNGNQVGEFRGYAYVFDQSEWDDYQQEGRDKRDRNRLENWNFWRDTCPIELVREICALLDAKMPPKVTP